MKMIYDKKEDILRISFNEEPLVSEILHGENVKVGMTAGKGVGQITILGAQAAELLPVSVTPKKFFKKVKKPKKKKKDEKQQKQQQVESLPLTSADQKKHKKKKQCCESYKKKGKRCKRCPDTDTPTSLQF